MHIALIIDQERLMHEQVMLNRLCIGLMAESVQLTRIVPDAMPPEQVDPGEQRIALAARIEAPMSVLPWMRRNRVAQIVETLDKSVPDVVYAIGDKAWQLGIDLGQALKRPVLIDVWCLEQVKKRPKSTETSAIAGYVVPCKPLADALSARVEPGLINVVPMGVSLPQEVPDILSNVEQSVTVAVIGGCRDRVAYHSLLVGLSGALKQAPNLQVFLELQGPHEHDIWKLTEKLDLFGSISAIGEASQYRSLLVHCDMLLMPERSGEWRSIMLEAMALGMPIVCAADEALDLLVDGQTARFVGTNTADRWNQTVLELVSQPAAARELGLHGRDAVAARHRSSAQVTKLLEALGGVVGRGSFSIAGVLP